MLTFYEKHNFKLFPCNFDKTPRVESWRASQAHISADKAQSLMDTGHYVGAWLPSNYVVIDVDMNHVDKLGNEKPPGLPVFKSLIEKMGIKSDPFKDTIVVKTGSGGFHLYFKLPPEVDYTTLSQKSIAESVDVRTHLGYVIAAGTNGYTVHNDAPAMELPASLLSLIQKKTKEKAKNHQPPKELPIALLKKTLSKLDAPVFGTNDAWQEFITSCIAVSGNSPEVLDTLEEWSKSDPTYAKDQTVRKRIETFEPDGGITVGTFLYILKTHDVSKYLVDKIRLAIGAQFNFSQRFSESYEIPFNVHYEKIAEEHTLASALFYANHQNAAITLFCALVKSNLLYSTTERLFYYFDGNRWVEQPGIQGVIFSVLLHAGVRFYTDHSKKKDADADDYLNKYVGFIGSLAMIQKFETALKQHPDLVVKNPEWDSPALEATITLADAVMDFSDKATIRFRKGEREEFRRLYINLNEKDFSDAKPPEKFRAFLKDVFPDADTRKTATFALATMLSGTGKFRKFQIWNGAGSNGKSTLMELMKSIIGQRAISYRPAVLLSKHHSQSLTPELAAFRGALVAFASETEESKRVSQGAVKSLTGNETMTANPKYQGVIEFKTTFQLILSTNYLPAFSAHDSAFINRLLVLPFYTCFYKDEEEKERAKAKGSRHFVKSKDVVKLTGDILKERAQVLYYLAARYQQLGNAIPESVECLAVKKHYVDDNDDITQFLTEFCESNTAPEGMNFYFTPTRDIVNFYNEENNTRYSSKFVIMRLKEVFPNVETASKKIDGKLTRGVKNIRLKMDAYPEGYTGNYTKEELMKGTDI